MLHLIWPTILMWINPNPGTHFPTTFDIGLDCTIEFIWLQPGSFVMGSPEDELGRLQGETQHKVTLTRQFALAKYEVTQQQYQIIMGTNPSQNQSWGLNTPVENLTWQEAIEFCGRLTQKFENQLPTGYQFSLPTEAQWEYACREEGKKAGPIYTGAITVGEDNCSVPELEIISWYCGNQGAQTSKPVGQKMPNALGFYDMIGNVWEWCLDRYAPYKGDSIDPQGPEQGIRRTRRGGYWGNNFWYHRSACRGVGWPDSRSHGTGFRVALVYKPST